MAKPRDALPRTSSRPENRGQPVRVLHARAGSRREFVIGCVYFAFSRRSITSKEYIVKNQSAQAVVGTDPSRTDNPAFETIPVRTMPEQPADESSHADSLDIPLNYGGMMDAVRDAVRANL